MIAGKGIIRPEYNGFLLGDVVQVPDILYKYTTSSTTQIVLETGRLRWQSPCQFNDVAELQRMPTLSPDFDEARPIYVNRLLEIGYSDLITDYSSYSEWTQYILRLIQKLKVQGVPSADVRQMLNSVVPNSTVKLESLFRRSTELNNDGSLRIFCLTENVLNDLMWAHYGDSNKGCMLGFRHIDEYSTPFAAAEKVRYTDETPVIGSAVDFYLYGPSAAQNKETRLAIYHTKKSAWTYENEWRVIHKSNTPNGKLYSDFKFYPEELESVTFGLKITPDDKDKIINLVQLGYPHCKLYEIVMIDGELRRQQCTVG